MRLTRTRRLAGLADVLGGIAAAGVVAAGSGGETAPDALGAKIVRIARDQVGHRYEYGGEGPHRYDCSGLVWRLWRDAGFVKDVPRVSRDQQAWAVPLSAAQLRPGDLVFWGNPVHHVGIYIGGGRVVDASSSRGGVVERPIWTSDVVRYGRVPRPGFGRPGRPPVLRPAPRPLPPVVLHRGMRPVPALGHRPRTLPGVPARDFARLVRSRDGVAWGPKGRGTTFDAAGLVRWAWAGRRLGWMPDTPAALERASVPVALADVRLGDLVIYGAPAVHVGIYLGDGQMVDASRVLRRVVVRRVFPSETVRFARLPFPPR